MNHAAPVRHRHTGRIVAASATIAALSVFGLVVPAAQAATVDLQILTFNDFHGRINASTASFATSVEKLRATDGANGANTLLVSTGDIIGASEFASSSADDQPTIDVFNALELDASAVGNHEFDQGYSDLVDDVIAGGTNAQWDYLGANVYQAGTQTPALPEYATFERAGVTIAVVGAVTQETPTLVSPGGVDTLSFGDPVEAVNRVAAQLTDGDAANGEADVILAAYHEGAPRSQSAATLDQQVADSAVFAEMVNDTSAAVDVILNGHTHQAYAYAAPVPGDASRTRAVVQTGSYGANIGQISLAYDTETDVATIVANAVVPATTPVDTVTYPRVAAVKTIVDAALAAAAVIGNQPVGTLTASVTTAFTDPAGPPVSPNRDDRGKESTLGTLVADAVLSSLTSPERGGAEIAFVNPGGLRNELVYAANAQNPADSDGTILFSEANAVLPFLNNLATVDMTGAQVKTLLEQQWQRDANGNVPSRSYLALGTSTGFSYTFDAALPEGSRITSMMLNGAPVDPAETYRVGTFTFLAGTGTPSSAGGDNFWVFREATNFRDSGLIDRDAWISYLGANQPVSPSFEKHSVSVSGLNTAPVAGETQTLSVGSFDLKSAGSPVNTALTASFAATADGAGAVEVGSAAISANAATIDVTFPLSAAGTSDYLLLTAAPSGTQAVIPVTVAAPAATVTATAKTVQYGTAPKIVVTVAAAGQTPTGAVTVTDAAGAALGTANLANGTATVSLGKTALQPGTHTLTVSYAGSATAGAASTTVDVVVKKASSSTLGLSTSIFVSKGKTSKVFVLTTANGGVPVDGPVTISSGGKVIGTGVVKNGTATVSIAPFTSRGIKILTVSYGGSATVAPSNGPGLVIVL